MPCRSYLLLSYNAEIDVPQLKSDLPDLVEVIEEEGDDSDKDKEGKVKKAESESGGVGEGDCKQQKSASSSFVRLLPIQLCAARIESLIKDFDGKLYCSELEAAFVDKYKTPLYPGQFGFPSVNTLIGTGLAKVGFSNSLMLCLRGRMVLPNLYGHNNVQCK